MQLFAGLLRRFKRTTIHLLHHSSTAAPAQPVHKRLERPRDLQQENKALLTQHKTCATVNQLRITVL
jgi:hypothetical protein